MTARFLITDGTTTVRLINGPYHVANWRPQAPEYKGGGVWHDSPLSEGRQLVSAKYDLITESIDLVLRGHNQDEAIRFSQELRRLLEKAGRYWTTPHKTEPIWLEARASSETNTRYALVYQGRLLDDGPPFSQPFLQPDCSAVMTELSLVVQHGHWLSLPPGDSECVRLTLLTDEVDDSYLAKVLTTSPFAVWPLYETAGTTAQDGSPNNFDGTYSGVTLDDDTFTNGDPAVEITNTTGYVNIYSTGMADRFDPENGAALLWFKPPSAGWWTDGNTHYLLSLWGGNNDNILVAKSGDNTLIFSYKVSTAGSPGSQKVTFSATGLSSTQWTSILVGWQTLILAGVRYIVPFMVVNGAPIGAELIPNASPTHILFANRTVVGALNTTPDDNAGDAHMAYVALWNRALDLDEIAMLTEAPPLAYEPAENEDAFCTPMGFASNEQGIARLEYIFRFDASTATYVDLLQSVLPYSILPSPPAAGDIVYFGTAYPFGNLVFDLLSSVGVTGHWEYWNGAWTTLPALATPGYIRDNTNTFLNPGVGSVVWGQPSDWATTTVNGVAGLYWVRFIVDSVSSPTAPQQQNRQIYTQTAPYIEVDGDEVGGDIEAILRMLVRNDWHDEDNALLASRTINLHVARWPVERGSQFTPFINLTDVVGDPSQAQPGISVAAGVDTVFANDSEASTGRKLRYSGGASASSFETVATISFDPAMTRQYLGRFRPMLRTTTTNQTGSHTQVRLKVIAGREVYSSTFVNGPTVYRLGPFALFTFEPITLGPSLVLRDGETFHKFTIEIQVKELGTAAHTVDMYDLILLPVDDWYAELDAAGDIILAENDYAPGYTQLLVDSVTNPKRQIRAVSTRQDFEYALVGTWLVRAPGPLTIEPNKRTRFFIFSAAGNNASPHVLLRAGLEKSQRYLTARGNR